MSYDSTNPAQRDIPASCHETSALTITNGGTDQQPVIVEQWRVGLCTVEVHNPTRRLATRA